MNTVQLLITLCCESHPLGRASGKAYYIRNMQFPIILLARKTCSSHGHWKLRAFQMFIAWIIALIQVRCIQNSKSETQYKFAFYINANAIISHNRVLINGTSSWNWAGFSGGTKLSDELGFLVWRQQKPDCKLNQQPKSHNNKIHSREMYANVNGC